MLHFIFGLFLFVVVVVAFIAFPALRIVGLIVVGAIGVLIAIMISNDNKKQEENRQFQRVLAQQEAVYRAKAQTAIASDQISLSNMNIKLAYGDQWEVSGLVTNNARTELTGLSLAVILKDCLSDRTRCLTVGNATLKSRIMAVPPGQGRTFSVSGTFPNTPKVALQWSYTVAGIEGKPE